MKQSLWLSSLALAGTAAAFRRNISGLGKRGLSETALPEVPTYNISMPIDHFTASDTRTYNNRYFVNDTYFKPGGPVILFDAGENGMDDDFAAEMMSEYNDAVSGPLRLAAKLNGVVVGWEHRYYGYSQPFDVNEETGVPVDGAQAYKYLTIEQGLEDLVYFANNFNKTTLDQNSVIQSTSNLDPYHTPWIHFGGSYTGNRAAWSRVRNPEIFYASWSSSAPVEVLVDGSIYWNPVARSLPSNCTKDFKAISHYVDETLSSGDETSIQAIKAGVYLMQPENILDPDLSVANQLTPAEVLNIMLNGAIDTNFQNLGPSKTTQIFCDYIQSFDTDAYMASRKDLSANATKVDIALTALKNKGHAAAKGNGIAASNGNDGPSLAFAAFTYAYYSYKGWFSKFASTIPQDKGNYTRAAVDGNSWYWQCFSEFGYYQYTNLTTNKDTFASKYLDEQQFITSYQSTYTGFKPSDFPAAVNTSYAMSYKGWDMKPSNTMFTNGEFDPWRAFGISSQEQEVGAPTRTLTQTVPKCNTPPSDTDVFGLLYPGATHVEDMHIPSGYTAGSEATGQDQPLYQGLDLFLKAWEVWQPCFETSRDTIRTGKGVDGSGHTADGSSTSSSSTTSSKNSAGRNTATNNYMAMLGLIAVLFSTL